MLNIKDKKMSDTQPQLKITLETMPQELALLADNFANSAQTYGDGSKAKDTVLISNGETTYIAARETDKNISNRWTVTTNVMVDDNSYPDFHANTPEEAASELGKRVAELTFPTEKLNEIITRALIDCKNKITGFEIA